MRILVTGGKGQLAWALKNCQKAKKHELIALSRDELDITDLSQAAAVILQYQPHLIINTAAYTAVDKAETEPENAFKVNSDGAKVLANCCRKQEIPLIHLSTDYVFDGMKKSPYTETDDPQPINVYGKSKYQGEQQIRKYLPQHIILRVSGTFGKSGRNFVKTILQLAAEREKLTVVSDQITCPTYAVDIAHACFVIVDKIFKQKPLWGRYHYCSKEPISWHAFSCEIIKKAREYQKFAIKNIVPINSEEVSALAKRPFNSVLDCGKIYRLFGIEQPCWRECLNKLIEELVS